MKVDPVTNASDDRGPLRFIACGSVDDGKSTLIGRLLSRVPCSFATTSWRR